jgi:diguanylate cyclase (GGDEF)-like protein
MTQLETASSAGEEGDGPRSTEVLTEARQPRADDCFDEARTLTDDHKKLRDGRQSASHRLQAARGDDVQLLAREARARAAADRAAAASDRQHAAEDREAAAALRAAAARDRRHAVRERKLAGTDQLTGVNLRAVGLGEIKREIARARRTRTPLALVFVDVNNLKAVNDSQGHLAGDTLLRQVAETFRAKLRPYDVLMRFGGDEFVCALPHADAEDARARFAEIIESLEADGFAAPISFGVATLEAHDDLERLLARADKDLIETRRASSGHRSTPG